MNIIHSKQAVKAINYMDNATKKRIKAAIEKLPDGDTKPIDNNISASDRRVESAIFSCR
jgi:hypothetical protein